MSDVTFKTGEGNANALMSEEEFDAVKVLIEQEICDKISFTVTGCVNDEDTREEVTDVIVQYLSQYKHKPYRVEVGEFLPEKQALVVSIIKNTIDSKAD